MNVHLQLGARINVVTVPTAAIQLGKVGSYVYTVNEDSTVSISKIVPGPVSGDNTVVENGLQSGQKVVIDGLDKLRDGAKIKVVDRSAKVDATAGSDTTHGHHSHHKDDASGAASASASASHSASD